MKRQIGWMTGLRRLCENTVVGLLLVVCLHTAGCGSIKDEKFEPRDLEGKIDESLAKPLKARQEVIARWLRGMHEGIGELAGLQLLVPGVDMREGFEQFYNGHKRLVRWEFNGQPQGNDVPVALYFDEKESGVFDERQLVREDRVYSVSIAGNRSSIARAKK